MLRRKSNDFVCTIARNQRLIEIGPSSDPRCLRKCLIPPSKFHITLFVLYLETNDHLKRARTILEDCRDLFTEFFSATSAQLEFSGVNHFNSHSVIYTSPKDGAATESFEHLVCPSVSQL